MMSVGAVPVARGQLFDPVIELGQLNGDDGFTMLGVASGDDCGWTVALLPDVNGDGVGDIAVGSPRSDRGTSAENSGRCYVVFGSSDAPKARNLGGLNGQSGFRAPGIASFDSAGLSVAGLGDVNGDGLGDLVIGARGADPNGLEEAGSTYVVYGSAAIGTGGSIDLASLVGTNGFRIDGPEAGYGVGYAVAGAGDVNGDGFADVLVGGPEADAAGRTDAGAAFVVFGGAEAGGSGVFALSSVNGENGFRIDGAAGRDFSAISLAGLEDVNGDGFDDIAIGSAGADGGAGKVHVLFGSAEMGAAGRIDLANLAPGQGIALTGSAAGEGAGRSVAGAGDVNGDGWADVVIGAPLADPFNRTDGGSAYVVYGGAQLASFSLGSVNGQNGFRVDGVAAGDKLGTSVAGASIDKTIYGDVMFGAPGAKVEGSAVGAIYVLRGAAGLGVPGGRVSLAGLDGESGFVLNGKNGGDQTGFSLGGGVDVNGDGVEDLAIGAPFGVNSARDRTGIAFAFYGKRDVETLALSAGAFVIGARTRLICTGADAGELVRFRYSTKGAGPTYVAAIDLTLDLSAPIQAFGQAIADESGAATVNPKIAARNFAPGPIWVQALAVRPDGSVKSNLVESEITN